MSITYENIEDAIVERLKPFEVLPKFQVVAQPENLAEFQKQMIDGRITVMYDGSRFENNGSGMELRTMSVDSAVQEETVHIKTLIESRKLRGDKGIYDLIRLCRTHLAGFSPAGADPLKQVDTQFVNYNENTWAYEIKWGTRILNIEAQEDTDDPLLKTITFDEEFS